MINELKYKRLVNLFRKYVSISGKTFDQACDLAISFLENQIKVWESDNDNENK